MDGRLREVVHVEATCNYNIDCYFSWATGYFDFSYLDSRFWDPVYISTNTGDSKSRVVPLVFSLV